MDVQTWKAKSTEPKSPRLSAFKFQIQNQEINVDKQLWMIHQEEIQCTLHTPHWSHLVAVSSITLNSTQKFNENQTLNQKRN